MSGGPELEALRVAVHHPERVAARLHQVLFTDPTILAGYRALCASATLHDAINCAIAGGQPHAAALLHRLAVEDAESDPDDVLARLAEAAAQRKLSPISTPAPASPPTT